MSDQSQYSQTPPRNRRSRRSGSRASASTAPRSTSNFSPPENNKALVLHSARPRHTSSSIVSTGTRRSSRTALDRSVSSGVQQSSYADGGQSQVQGRVPQNYFTSRPAPLPPVQLYAVMDKIEERTTYWEDGVPGDTVPSVTYKTTIVTKDDLDEGMAKQLQRLELAQSKLAHREQRQRAQSSYSHTNGLQQTPGRVLGEIDEHPVGEEIRSRGSTQSRSGSHQQSLPPLQDNSSRQGGRTGKRSNGPGRVLSDYDVAQSALSQTSQSHHQRGADGVPLSTVAPRHSISQVSGPSRRASRHGSSKCVFADTEMAR
jgi:hypothetical protein